MGGSNVWVNGKKSAAMGNPVLMLDARVPASYSGSGSDWNNLAIDGTQATFENAPGFDDGAIVFDGSTRANMNLLDITFTYNGDWSIELFINPEPTQAMYAGVFGDHDCSGTTGMVMQQRGGRNNGYYFGTGSSSAPVGWRRLGNADLAQDPTMVAPTGEWTHIVITAKKGGQFLFYVNGESIMTDTVQPGGYPFDCKMVMLSRFGCCPSR